LKARSKNFRLQDCIFRIRDVSGQKISLEMSSKSLKSKKDNP